MSLYVVAACSALAAFLLAFALVREARLRRALTTFLSMMMDRNRSKNVRIRQTRSRAARALLRFGAESDSVEDESC